MVRQLRDCYQQEAGGTREGSGASEDQEWGHPMGDRDAATA